jgi:orotate phosphoribosyltransferase
MMTSVESTSEALARDLLRIGAVTLSPQSAYTWASGLRSPVYCDNRMALGYPDVRMCIQEGFVELISDRGLACDVVGGIATAGIPHAAWVADRLEKPLIYVRSEPKAHGRGRQIEGPVSAGQRVVLIEDLVSTGRSSVAAIAPLREAGCEVSAVLAIFTYGLDRARAAFAEAGTPLFTLTDFPALVKVAERSGAISNEDLDSLMSWYTDPIAWSEAMGA